MFNDIMTNPSTLFSKIPLLVSAIAICCSSVQAATADEWRARSIYQVITDRFALTNGSTDTTNCPQGTNKFCGGSYQGIISKLDYIQGMGFTAIWISPVTENVVGNAQIGDPYHGFWPSDVTAINHHFGTADDLKQLSAELHKRDMYLMIDVVANNMAWVGDYSTIDYTKFKPWNDPKYFHPYCPISDYGNWTLAQICWLAGSSVSLPDLDTESEEVIKVYIDWAKTMINDYGVDGFRIDAAKHVSKPFWARFQPEVGIYMVGEVFDGGVQAVCSFQSNTKALNGVLNYAMWYAIVATYTNTSWPMTTLMYQYTNIVENCQDSTLLGTFTENHDVARIANVTTDVSMQMNALAWAMMGDGIPIVYYGAEQAFSAGKDPWNREPMWGSKYDTTGALYGLIAACNVARSAIFNNAKYDYWTPYWTWKTKIIAYGPDYLAVRKGYDVSNLLITTNRGSTAKAIGPIKFGNTNFAEGDTIVDLVGCSTMKVGIYGEITVTIPAGGKPMVYVPARYVYDTKLCPNLKMSQYKGATVPRAVISANLQLSDANLIRVGIMSLAPLLLVSAILL